MDIANNYKILIHKLVSKLGNGARVRLKVYNKTNGVLVFVTDKIGKVTKGPYLVDFKSTIPLEDLKLVIEYNDQLDIVKIGDIEEI